VGAVGIDDVGQHAHRQRGPQRERVVGGDVAHPRQRLHHWRERQAVVRRREQLRDRRARRVAGAVQLAVQLGAAQLEMLVAPALAVRRALGRQCRRDGGDQRSCNGE
jgi:hypothetical protein